MCASVIIIIIGERLVLGGSWLLSQADTIPFHPVPWGYPVLNMDNFQGLITGVPPPGGFLLLPILVHPQAAPSLIYEWWTPTPVLSF